MSDDSTDEAREHANLMAKFGISRAQVEVYRYREFRYGNLKDAVAQARRDQETAKVF